MLDGSKAVSCEAGGSISCEGVHFGSQFVLAVSQDKPTTLAWHCTWPHSISPPVKLLRLLQKTETAAAIAGGRQ